jgi:hypothetical protein
MSKDDEQDVEDILGDFAKKKKKINSKKKGNRVELELTKILTSRFNKPFSRSVGSGNRWGQVSNMPTHAKTTLTGDICPPEGFKWVIECKGGYEDKIDLNGVFKDGCTTLDGFIEQSERDCEQSGRQPIIIWKRAFKPWLAMVKKTDLADMHFEFTMHYKNWIIVPLEELLREDDHYWFKEGTYDVQGNDTKA